MRGQTLLVLTLIINETKHFPTTTGRAMVAMATPASI